MTNPVQQVMRVLPVLDKINGCVLKSYSSLYQTEAIAEMDQDDYINAVVCLRTNLQPFDLLANLQKIEQDFHRKRYKNKRWMPRTMDLDILLYADLQLSDSRLTIPHPEIINRLFVLQPLKEISPDLVICGSDDLDKLIRRAPPMRIKRLEMDVNLNP